MPNMSIFFFIKVLCINITRYLNINLHYCFQRHGNPDFRVSHKSMCTSPLQISSLFYNAFDRTGN